MKPSVAARRYPELHGKQAVLERPLRRRRRSMQVRTRNCESVAASVWRVIST